MKFLLFITNDVYFAIKNQKSTEIFSFFLTNAFFISSFYSTGLGNFSSGKA